MILQALACLSRKIPAYKPELVHVLVEFNGILYDVSKPDGIHAQELIRAMIANGMEL